VIHKFRCNNKNFVLDVPTGSLLEVDDTSFLCFGEEAFMPPLQRGWQAKPDGGVQHADKPHRYAEPLSKEVLKAVFSDIQQLIDKGIIYTKDKFEAS